MDLKLWSKLGFGLLIVISLAILVERLTAVNEVLVPEFEDIEKIRDPTPTTAPVLNEVFSKCLEDHVKSQYIYVPEKDNVTFHSHTHEKIDYENSSLNGFSNCPLTPDLCMYFFIKDFSEVMTSLDIKLKLMEPSMLFCLLSKAKRFSLLTRGFSPLKLKSLKNVVAFAITEKEANIIDMKSSRLKIARSGFRIQIFTKRGIFKVHGGQFDEARQYFIKYNEYIIQLIVLYPRETYLWHPGLNASEIQSKNMLFIDDGAYDNFTTTPLDLGSLSTEQIHLPSESQCFLLETLSSRFLECNNITSEVKQSPLEPLQKQAVAAIQEMKRILGSQMVSFWLWSKSLLGWFDKCDILHYSTKLELSLALKSVEGYNFSALFADSRCHTVKQDFNLSTDSNIELECQDIPVTIALMHEDKNLTWFSFEDETHRSYRQTFPLFEVCSTHVFGLKIHIPCFTKEIIETELGQKWRNSTHHQK